MAERAMYERVYGDKCERGVYRSAVEIAKDVRAFIKWARKVGEAGGGFDLPAGSKVSVRSDHNSIRVTVMAPAAWVYAAPGAPCDYATNCPSNGGHSLAASVVYRIIDTEMGRYNYDGSESQVDYFDKGFYGFVNIEANDGTGRYGGIVEDPTMEPVRGYGRFSSEVQAAWEATPYGAATEARYAEGRAAEQAADAARYEAEQAEAAAAQDAEVEAFAAEVEAFDGNPGDAAQLADDVEWLEAADATAAVLADVARAAAIMSAAPDEACRMGFEGRAVQLTWILDRHPGEGDEPGAPRELTELFVGYQKGRGYYGSLNRATRQAPDSGPFTATTCSPLDAVRLDWTAPAPRFNRKALVEAAKAAVAHVQDPANRERYLGKFRALAPATPGR